MVNEQERESRDMICCFKPDKPLINFTKFSSSETQGQSVGSIKCSW